MAITTDGVLQGWWVEWVAVTQPHIQQKVVKLIGYFSVASITIILVNLRSVNETETQCIDTIFLNSSVRNNAVNSGTCDKHYEKTWDKWITDEYQSCEHGIKNILVIQYSYNMYFQDY